jgi:hypothetical protein
MTTDAKTPRPFDKVLNAFVEDLIAMSDAQALALAGVDSAAILKDGRSLLDRAKAEAGRRRLATARARIEEARADPQGTGPVEASVKEAREFLLGAANDGRYTLAARDLQEMSDEDALRLYSQMKRLEREVFPGKKDST